MREPSEQKVEGPAVGAAGTLGVPALEWSAQQILGAGQGEDKLRHIRSEWAPRGLLASALEIHEDTLHRRAKAAGVRTKLEVTAGNRCRVLYLVGDLRALLAEREAEHEPPR